MALRFLSGESWNNRSAEDTPKTFPRRPETDSSWHRFWDRFLDASWNEFGSSGGQDAAMTAQDGAKTAQDDTKMAPRCRQDGVISFQDAPKTRPDAPKAVINSNMSNISKSIEKQRNFMVFGTVWEALAKPNCSQDVLRSAMAGHYGAKTPPVWAKMTLRRRSEDTLRCVQGRRG